MPVHYAPRTPAFRVDSADELAGFVTGQNVRRSSWSASIDPRRFPPSRRIDSRWRRRTSPRGSSTTSCTGATRSDVRRDRRRPAARPSPSGERFATASARDAAARRARADRRRPLTRTAGAGIEERDLRARAGARGGPGGDRPAVVTWRPRGDADDELAAEEIGLDLVGERVDRHVHRGGEGLDAGRAAVEDADQRLQVAAVLLVEPLGVDLLHGEGVAGDRQGDVAVGAGEWRSRGPSGGGRWRAGACRGSARPAPRRPRARSSCAAWRR